MLLCMACHVVLPYRWVECPHPDWCRKLVHHEGLAEELNALPEEWLSAMLGFTIGRLGFLDVNAVFFSGVDGHPHCVGGPAAEDSDGTLYWFLDGRIHREGGPAVMKATGDDLWYEHGALERIDCCVVEHFNSKGVRQWKLEGPHGSSALYIFNSSPVPSDDGVWRWKVYNALPDAMYHEPVITAYPDGRTEWFKGSVRMSVKFLQSCGGCGWFDCGD